MNYDVEMQRLFLSLILGNNDLFVTTRKILKPDFFAPELQPAVEAIIAYENEYNGLPSPQVLESVTGIEVPKIDQSNSAEKKWFLDEFPKFCLRKSISNAIMEASKYVKDERYEEMEKLIKDSMKVRLQQDYGLDYGESPKDRLLNIKNRSGNLTTGFQALDKAVGKVNFGDLVIFVGASGCVTHDTKVKLIKVPTIDQTKITKIKSDNTEKSQYIQQFYNTIDTSYLEDTYIEILCETLQPQDIEIGSLKDNYMTSDYYYMVSSPDGWVPVLDCVEKTKDEMYAVEIEGKTIKASHDHLFQKPDNSWWYARDLVEGDELITTNGSSKITNIIPYKEQTLVYDLSVNHDNHRYYTEGVCSHNTGKSLMLQNQANIHWKNGKNVIYFTLELHPELCARRMDAMNLDITTDNLYDDIDVTDVAIKQIAQKAGKMRIVYLPSGSKTSEIKAFIEDYEQTLGIKVDVICVDYLDLLSPVEKVSLGDTFHKDKFVSEELRNMSQELGILTLTASQVNRTGVSAATDDMNHSHIAGGLSKINTADLVIGLIVDATRKAQGVYELQALKVRNGVGTGRRVRIKYNEFTMRMADDPDFLRDMDSLSNMGLNKTVLSESEKVMNHIQNTLNSNNKEYDPIDIETGKVIPSDIRGDHLGMDKLSRINNMLNDDDI